MKLHIGPEMVLDYFIFKNKSRYGFRLFLPFHFPLIIEPLDGRDAATSLGKRIKIEKFVRLEKF